MATTLIKDSIPCRYIIAKYVEDEIKDEPINVGIIIQSQKDFTIVPRFVTNYLGWKLRYASSESTALVRGILKKLEKEILSTAGNRDTLDKIISKYTGKIRFTDPRGTITTDLYNESKFLFDRLVSAKRYTDDQFRITHDLIMKQVYLFLHKRINVRKEYMIAGQTSKSRYDIAILDEDPFYLQTISFDEKTALQKIKLFDWSVKDTKLKHTDLTVQNFGVIFSEPSKDKDSQRYRKMKEQYDEGVEILSYNDYPSITYGSDGRWKKEIEKHAESQAS
jgi:hypothetical protein